MKLDSSKVGPASSFLTGKEGKESVEFTPAQIGLQLKNNCDLRISETRGVYK